MRTPNRPRPSTAARRHPAPTARRRTRRAWQVEALEGRALLSVVSNTNDGGPGSLRDAIDTATPGELITFDPTLKGSIIDLNSGLEVKTSLTIRGLGATDLTVDGVNSGTVVTVDAGVTASISGLTITGGLATYPSSGGGGIINAGTLTLTGVAVTRNEASLFGLSGSTFGGGGIVNTGTLTLQNTAVNQNVIDLQPGFTPGFSYVAAAGGGIWNDGGTLTALDSTIADNRIITSGIMQQFPDSFPVVPSPTVEGGGIASTAGDVTIVGSQVTGNTVDGISTANTPGRLALLTLVA
jgi:hypothetical protein